MEAQCGSAFDNANCTGCGFAEAWSGKFLGETIGHCEGYSVEENRIDPYTAYFGCQEYSGPEDGCPSGCFAAQTFGFGAINPPSCGGLDLTGQDVGFSRGIYVSGPGGGQPPQLAGIQIDNNICTEYTPTIIPIDGGWAFRA